MSPYYLNLGGKENEDLILSNLVQLRMRAVVIILRYYYCTVYIITIDQNIRSVENLKPPELSKGLKVKIGRK